MIECLHCKALNGSDERRCIRCGRRLHPSAPQAAPDTYSPQLEVSPELAARPAGWEAPLLSGAGKNNAGSSHGAGTLPAGTLPLMGSAVPALQPLPGGRATPVAPPAPPRHQQQSLFRDGMTGLEHGPAPKIVPIPVLTPVRSTAKRNHARSHSPRMASNRGLASAQQPFDFSTEAPDLANAAKADAVIYCDAAVALPIHRMMAAAVDASMIAVALGIFLAVFYFSGGSITWSKQMALILVGVAGAFTQLYRLLWCLADGDTPGMRFAGLRLVNFDGRPPGREQRGVRQAAYLLSVLSAGLGLIWALVDEENLTWHDHISKTFPTPN